MIAIIGLGREPIAGFIGPPAGAIIAYSKEDLHSHHPENRITEIQEAIGSFDILIQQIASDLSLRLEDAGCFLYPVEQENITFGIIKRKQYVRRSPFTKGTRWRIPYARPPPGRKTHKV